MELISCMKPNLWASLADEVPAWVTEKRNKVSVERTLRWLDACIALDEVWVNLYSAEVFSVSSWILAMSF